MKKTGIEVKGKKMPVGIILGMGITLALMLIISFIFAAMIDSGKIDILSTNRHSVIALYLSVLIGNLIAVKFINEKKIIVSIVHALGIITILLITGMLFLDGISSRLGTAVFVVIAAAASAIGIGALKIKKKGYMRIR